MPLLYLGEVTQIFLEKVLINVGVEKVYFPDAGHCLLVELSYEGYDCQIHQVYSPLHQQINNERLTFASLLQNLGLDFQLWDVDESFHCMSIPLVTGFLLRVR